MKINLFTFILSGNNVSFKYERIGLSEEEDDTEAYECRFVLLKNNVNFVFIIDRKIRFEALQSEAGQKLLRRSGRAPDDISSVVLVDKDR